MWRLWVQSGRIEMKIKFVGGTADGRLLEIPEPPPSYWLVVGEVQSDPWDYHFQAEYRLDRYQLWIDPEYRYVYKDSMIRSL